MKHLLAFTAFLAAGFLLGSRRARKAGPVTTLNVAVEVDTKDALKRLEELEQQVKKTTTVVAEFNLRGADLVGLNVPLCRADFSNKETA